MPTSTAHAKKILLNAAIISPLATWDANKKLTGSGIKVMPCIMDILDVEYEIQVYPWGRSQYLVEQGKAQDFFGHAKFNL